jgi:rubredoxin
MKANCRHEHTKYQPDTDSEWNCPECGVDNTDGPFYVEKVKGEEVNSV